MCQKIGRCVEPEKINACTIFPTIKFSAVPNFHEVQFSLQQYENVNEHSFPFICVPNYSPTFGAWSLCFFYLTELCYVISANQESGSELTPLRGPTANCIRLCDHHFGGKWKLPVALILERSKRSTSFIACCVGCFGNEKNLFTTPPSSQNLDPLGPISHPFTNYQNRAMVSVEWGWKCSVSATLAAFLALHWAGHIFLIQSVSGLLRSWYLLCIEMCRDNGI